MWGTAQICVIYWQFAPPPLLSNLTCFHVYSVKEKHPDISFLDVNLIRFEWILVITEDQCLAQHARSNCNLLLLLKYVALVMNHASIRVSPLHKAIKCPQ